MSRVSGENIVISPCIFSFSVLKCVKMRKNVEGLNMHIYCSTGAFIGKVNNRDYKLIPPTAEKLIFKELELMIVPAWYPESDLITETLLSLTARGISFPVVHFDKDIGENLSRGTKESIRNACGAFSENCRMGRALGAEKAVLHLWGGLPSDGHFLRNMSFYPEFRQEAEENGILLTVENVPCNTRDPLAHLETLKENYADAAFTIDTRFLAFHDEFGDFYSSGLVSNVKHIHISDWVAAPMQWEKLRPIPQPGEGHVDFLRFFSFLRRNGYSGSVTLESPAMFPGHIDTNLLNSNLTLLDRWCNGPGL